MLSKPGAREMKIGSRVIKYGIWTLGDFNYTEISKPQVLYTVIKTLYVHVVFGNLSQSSSKCCRLEDLHEIRRYGQCDWMYAA